ncbi:MAG TPA: hypothetical protein VMI94_17320 [Bryobacteraceae bacterium]|nr:hypothetical protein [Bryobacteraceae bacterium]
MRIYALVAVAATIAPCAAWAQCNPSPAVKSAIDGLPTQSADETEWHFRQRHDAALEALRARFPDDFFVERTYIEGAWRRDDKKKAIAEYKARHEKNPDDPQVAYLYGLALEGRQSKESIRLFEAALAKKPDFAWPNLSLATIYGMPVFLDKEARLKRAKAFLEACPDTLAGYEQLASVDDKAVLASYALKLRALLAPRTDDDAVGAYRTLWSIEFKAHSPSEYDPLRKQVAEDLKRLRALNRTDKRGWYNTLAAGYKLANDQKQADWAEDEQQRRVPQPWQLASMSKWYKDHQRPNTDDPAGKKRAYYSDLLKQTDAWSKERPKMADIWQSRLGAMEYLDDVPSAEVIAAADTFLKLADDDAGPEGTDAYSIGTVARVLYKKHLQPERVVELVDKDLAKLQIDFAEPMYDAYATKENLADEKFYQTENPVNPLGWKAGALIDMKQAAKAQMALTRMEDGLEALKPLVGDKADYKKEYTVRLAFWWQLKARAAELEGHDQDAMAYYEHALLTRLEAKEPPETGVKDEMADGARQLWTMLGGSNDGWQTWYGRQADILATQNTLTWEDANMPLPAFELTDMKGKTWTQASLKGKTTFLNFWASW